MVPVRVSDPEAEQIGTNICVIAGRRGGAGVTVFGFGLSPNLRHCFSPRISHRTAMEEAASLFGPADSTLDPFGNIVGGDSNSDRTTFLPSEPPPPEAQDVNSGGGWYNDQSGHYESQGPLNQEYNWQSSEAAGGHYNSQPRYGESTSPNSLTYRQQLNLHEGEHSQYSVPYDGE